MTILNVLLLGDRALIGTNTDAKWLDSGTRGSISKILPLSPMGAVVAGIGNMWLPLMAWMEAQKCGTSFDAAALGLLERLRTLMANDPALKSITPGSEQYLRLHYQDVCFVGWSERDHRMAGYVFSKFGPDDELKCEEMTERYWLAPWHESLDERFREPRDAEGLYRVALKQSAMMRRLAPQDGGSGGDFVIAELTPKKLEISTIGSLDDLELVMAGRPRRI